MGTTLRLRMLAFGVTACLVLSSPCQAIDEVFDPVIDSPMYRNPDLSPPRAPTGTMPEGTKDLWLKALQRPETDTRRQAADAIARAHRLGLKGMETTIDPLITAFDQPGQHPAVRLSVARALVALEARSAAARLFDVSQSGSEDMRQIVEPALARWDHRPARDVWLARLRDTATPRRSLILAIQGLATVREEKAFDPLLEMTLSDATPPPVRLEAARALGALRSAGLEKEAERLGSDTSPRGLGGRLAAASILRHHRGDAAVALLKRLAEDAEPAVVALAVARLIEIAPELVVAMVERLLSNPDASVRLLAVEVLYRHPGEKHIRLLGDSLDDAHLDVRRRARRCLEELGARSETRAGVIAEGSRVLATRPWRGLEQATILLCQLDHKPAAPRLLELLKFDRPEVYITAAWGLRRLAVPETLPEVTKFVEAQQSLARNVVGGRATTNLSLDLVDHQLSQLNQLLGAQRYGPADAVLRQFIPRMMGSSGPSVACSESRAAAIWALGLLHEGKPDAGLGTAFEARLKDTGSLPPEDLRVRLMSAVSLGRTGAKESVPSLQQFYSGQGLTNDIIGNGCGWAIERLTSEAMPTSKPFQRVWLDWFLMPQK